MRAAVLTLDHEWTDRADDFLVPQSDEITIRISSNLRAKKVTRTPARNVSIQQYTVTQARAVHHTSQPSFFHSVPSTGVIASRDSLPVSAIRTVINCCHGLSEGSNKLNDIGHTELDPPLTPTQLHLTSLGLKSIEVIAVANGDQLGMESSVCKQKVQRQGDDGLVSPVLLPS
ncbi:hypothetical protein PCASD_11557 [Puccinia coronata f. sp. avenae]|uniref:Uncharacterized protein n=1 Tax=Puccinia coronata f. sp. avenae TaxID=200324 RepID=A0A2N5TG14_9BASI|nr:hypothetical protein PCASD_11557 [Puccinia coronata f. sp. avenae]